MHFSSSISEDATRWLCREPTKVAVAIYDILGYQHYPSQKGENLHFPPPEPPEASLQGGWNWDNVPNMAHLFR